MLLIFFANFVNLGTFKEIMNTIFLGSVVLIHGQVMHKSEANLSEKPRHAYTFHMIETEGSVYSKENWLQPTKSLPFPKLFSPNL